MQGGHVVEIRVQRADAQARHQQRRHRQDVVAGNKQRRLRHAEDCLLYTSFRLSAPPPVRHAGNLVVAGQ